MSDTSMSYISRKSCGCLAMAVVDNPEHKRDVAREVGKAVRLGETVERVTSESVRIMEWVCPQHKRERGEKRSRTRKERDVPVP